jgi:hypothetical protein
LASLAKVCANSREAKVCANRPYTMSSVPDSSSESSLGSGDFLALTWPSWPRYTSLFAVAALIWSH